MNPQDKEQVIRQYFKDGARKGFHRDYLKSMLLRNGYDYAMVNMIYNSLSEGNPIPERPATPNPFIPQRPNPSFPSPGRLFLYLFLMVGIIGGGYVLFTEFSADTPTGAAVLDSHEAALNEISELDQQIGERQAALQLQFDELQQKDLTIEEKNKIIQEQVADLDMLHQSIQEERDLVRNLLLDLFNTLVDKPSKFGQGQENPFTVDDGEDVD